MSDYPSDDEQAEWFRLAWRGAGPRDLVRFAVDWGRANPAPQEPHALGDYGECASWCRVCAKNVAAGRNPDGTTPPAEPTEAPKPTSGDKPPTTMSKLWFRMNAHAKEEEPDPRNPSPTPEPTREPDPWALPDGWTWDGDEYGWAMWGPNGGGITSIGPGGQAVLDLGEHRAVALSELCRRRDREDPPKGGETP